MTIAASISRVCGVCGVDISDKGSGARLCGQRCRKRASRASNPEREHEQARAQRAANREKIREQNRTWRAANLAKVREKARARYAANREKVREQDRAWTAANPERKRAIQARRRLRVRAASYLVLERDWRRIVHRYRGLCAYCGVNPIEHHEHVVPLIRGGVDGIGNLLPACGPCNWRKQTKLLAEWRYRDNEATALLMRGGVAS